MRIPSIFRRQIVDLFHTNSVNNLGRVVVGACLLMAISSRPAYADPALPVISNQTFAVTNTVYGAVGDGTTDNTSAIQNAIDDASANGGGTVLIPAAGTLSTYLCGPLTLASHINLQIDGGATLKALPLATFTNYPPQNLTFPDLIYAKNMTDIEISGSGTIDGQGADWWTAPSSVRNNRPYMIFFNGGCQRVWIHGVTLINPQKMHIVFKGVDSDITVDGITINTTDDLAANTDGIDLVGTHCLIQNSIINSGDDNIAIGSSSASAVSTDILITNCTFGVGHGVSIGSNTAGGVSNMTVVACTFDGTDYGIRMKSDNKTSGGSGQGGVAQNLTYSDITMSNIIYGAIVLYSYYSEYGTPYNITPSTAAAQTVGAVPFPIWRDITISNVSAVVTGRIAGIIWGRKEVPFTNVVLRSVNITAPSTFNIYNAQGIQVIDSQITVPGTTNMFNFYDAEVTITNNTLTTNLVTLGGLATPGTNNTLSFFNTQAALNDPTILGTDPLLALASSTITMSTDLSLGGSTSLNFGLGTNSTEIEVIGNLSLGGTLNISDYSGFTAGTYTLFSYSGTLIDNGLTIGTTPDGTMIYTLDTSTTGLVKLVAAVPVVADFSGNPTSGFVPLMVTFTDTSTGPITNRFWDFGDGTTSNTTATSIMHTYTVDGTNTVRLIVSGTSGVSTSTLAAYIAASPCTATLSATNVSFGATGGSDSVTVTPDTNVCTWTATSNDAWIQITGESVITNGSAAVGYTVLPNANSTSPRMGTMTIAGQTFTVTEAGDTSAPTVTLTAPNPGLVSGFIVVGATVADNVGVTKVDFYRDNSILIGTFNAPSYSLSFNTATLGDASACFYATAYDGAGNSGSSSTNCVAVDNSAVLPSLLGDYNGLVIQTNAPSHESSGPVSFKVSKTGSFKAKLTLGGGRHLSFNGQFDGSGNATNTIVRKGLDPLQVAIHLDLAGSDQIVGTVSDSSFTSVLIADRAAFDARNPCPNAGDFSILLAPPMSDDPNVPQGFGYGTLSVTPTGRGQLRGYLGDGTKIRIRASVSKLGTWPLYETLYKKNGAAIGWVTFSTNDTLEATVDWFRPPLSSSSLYPLGFATNLTLTGTRYVPPARGNTSGAGNYQITLGGGNLESDITKDAYLYSIGNVTVLSANPESIQMKVDPVTGQFKGSFFHPSLNKTVKFTGLLPDFRSTGAGYFLGATESGFVIFVPTQ
jgi:polygalacturonase